MADSDPASPVSAKSPLAASTVRFWNHRFDLGRDEDPFSCFQEEDLQPVRPKIESELLTKLHGLKEDVLGWRSKLDTQVKTYKDELSQLKEALNTELEQLRSDFQELRTTLQQQQEDVTASLRNLGLQDGSEHTDESEIQGNNDNYEKAQAPPSDSMKEADPSDGSIAESSPKLAN